MSKMIFVNLPVADLAAATEFYKAIGCFRNDQFSDAQASSMVWSDTITFQLLTREYFASFISRKIPDAHQTCQMLLALSHGSREEVDNVIAAGSAAGGDAKVRDVMDMGWLYNCAIADPDGHILEMTWMDPAGMPSETE